MTTAVTQSPAVEDERIPDRGDHLEQREHFLSDAVVFLNRGDRLQASEKMWGAVAQTIAHIADERGWQHRTHQQAGNIARYLGMEAGDGRIGNLYEVANGLHSNFYHDDREIWSIAAQLPNVRELIRRLEAAHRTVPRNTADPHAVGAEQEQIAERLLESGMNRDEAIVAATRLEHDLRHSPSSPSVRTIDGRQVTMRPDGRIEFSQQQTEHHRRPRSGDGRLRDRNAGPR